MLIRPCARYRFGSAGKPEIEPFAGCTLGIRAIAKEILDLGEETRRFWLGRTRRELFEFRQQLLLLLG
jgi:hypothetical protein